MIPIAFGIDGNSVTINGLEVGAACRHVAVVREGGDTVSLVKLELYANPVTVRPLSTTTERRAFSHAFADAIVERPEPA